MNKHLRLFCVACALAPIAAPAADIQFDPRIEVGAQMSDNYTLALPPARQFEVSGPFAEASIRLSAESPRTSWTLEPAIRARLFPGDEQFESNDYRVAGSVEQRGLKSRFGARADYFSEDVIQSEFPDASFDGAQLGDRVGGDGGRFSVDNRRDYLRLRPYAEFNLTERTLLRAEASYLDVSFDRSVSFSQESYNTVGGGLTLSSAISPASTLGVSVDYLKVDPDFGTGDTDLQGLRLQWDYRIAERVSAYARAGGRKSTFDRGRVGNVTLPKTDKTTPLLGAGARWAFLRSELFVDLQRDVDANSSGFAVRRDDLRVYYSQRFTERLRGFAAAYFIKDEATAATTLYSPRRYSVASLGAEWRLTRALALFGQVDRADQKFDAERSSSSNTSVRASVIYQPRRRD